MPQFRIYGSIKPLRKGGMDRPLVFWAKIRFLALCIECKKPVKEVNEELLKKNIIGGYDLSKTYPEMKNTMLICVTEKRTEAEMDKFVRILKNC